LESPSQRKKLLPLLKNESKREFENILDRYKRTHKLKIGINGIVAAQTLKEENGGEANTELL
jgi:hypothetical protein